MTDPIGRTELHTQLDRMSEQLMKQIEMGFEGVNRRLDVSNGRLGRAEETVSNHAAQLAVLFDRSNTAKATATIAATAAESATRKAAVVEKEVKAKPGRWNQSAIAGGIVVVLEIVKAVWAAKGAS